MKLKRPTHSGYTPPKQSEINEWVANHYTGSIDDSEELADALYEKFGLQGMMNTRAAIRARKYAKVTK